MRSDTLNSITLGVFAAGAMYLALWTGACGDGQRIHEKQTLVTGCLQKRSDGYVLERYDLPVTVATSGSAANVAEASSPDYRLKAKQETLDRYVGKQVKISGTLSSLQHDHAESTGDLAEIEVSSATLVADFCTTRQPD